MAFVVLTVCLAYEPSRSYARSLTLDDCISLALRQNPDLRAAGQEIRAARFRVDQAGALDAPSFSYEVGKLGTPVSREERETSARLSQEFGAPGGRQRARMLARADLAIVDAKTESIALKLTGDVTRAYRRLQADSLSLQRLESLRRTAMDFERMVSSRLRAGGARYLDVLRARAEGARIANDIVDADRSLHEDRRALNVLLGGDPEDQLEAADSMSYTALNDSLEAILAHALSSRPRLIAARLEVERAEMQMKLARAGGLPITSLSAGWDRVPGADSPGFGGGISFSLPFMPWTDRRARVEEALASSSSASDRLMSARREVDLAIRNAFAAARSTEQQVRQFDRILLADAADAIRTATQNYQTGQIDGLELFETLRTYRSIELEYIRALLNYELAVTDLSVVE